MHRSMILFPLLAACAGEIDATPEAATPEVQTADEGWLMAPPTPGSLGFGATTPVPGERMLFRASGAQAGDTVYFGLGFAKGNGPCPAELGGMCLGIKRPQLLGTATANANGVAELEVDVPDSVAAGDRVFFQAGSSGSGGDTSPVIRKFAADPIELQGAWDDNFGGAHDIDSRRWLNYSDTVVVTFDNVEEYAIAFNGPDAFVPNSWSRFDWTFDNGSYWYCQTAYDAASYEDALATPRSDDSDPANGGCGDFGFSWTQLIEAPLAIAGVYDDNFGGSHDVDATAWVQGFGSYNVSRFSNIEQYVIAQNDASNGFNPLLWSRFDWTEDTAGQLYYCQTEYAAASEADALYAAPSDASDPGTCGCGGACPGGFSWTAMTPAVP